MRRGVEEETRRDSSHPLATKCQPEIVINEYSHPGAHNCSDDANPNRNLNGLLTDEPAGWKGEDEAEDHKGRSEEVYHRGTLVVELLLSHSTFLI